MSATSYLYVPGNRGERFAKAEASGAGAVIFDLEDAVAPCDKDLARDLVGGHLDRPRPAGVEAWVRINDDESLVRDLDAVVGPHLRGVIPAKTSSRAGLDRLDALISALESSRDLPPGRIAVAPLVESAQGLTGVLEIARGPRVTALHLGEVDLAADLGVEPGPEETEFLFARSQMVVASAAAGIASPIAPVSTNFRDLDGYLASTRALRRLGFVGRACIHPAQLAAVHEVFTRSADEIATATETLRLLGEAGTGVAVGPDGRMIDEAVARQARRIVAQGRALADALAPESPSLRIH